MYKHVRRINHTNTFMRTASLKIAASRHNPQIVSRTVQLKVSHDLGGLMKNRPHVLRESRNKSFCRGANTLFSEFYLIECPFPSKAKRCVDTPVRPLPQMTIRGIMTPIKRQSPNLENVSLGGTFTPLAPRSDRTLENSKKDMHCSVSGHPVIGALRWTFVQLISP